MPKRMKAASSDADLHIVVGSGGDFSRVESLKIATLPAMSASDLSSLAALFESVLVEALERAPLINGGKEDEAINLVYTYVPKRTELYFITTDGTTVKERRMVGITHEGEYADQDRVLCMLTGDFHTVSESIREHVDEYQYIREKQFILLSFLNNNLPFAKHMLGQNGPINQYFYLHQDSSGNEMLYGRRSFFVKCYNQIENLMVVCQSVNLDKTQYIEMKDIHDLARGESFKDQVLSFINTHQLFEEDFLYSLNFGDDLHEGLLFHYVYDQAALAKSGAPAIQLIEGGNPIVLVKSDDSHPCLGLAEYMDQWFRTNRQDFIHSMDTLETLRSSAKEQAILLEQGFCTFGEMCVLEGRKANLVKTVFKDKLRVARKLIQSGEVPYGESPLSTDDEGRDDILERLSETFCKHYARMNRRNIDSFRLLLQVIQEYQFKDMAFYLEDRVEQFTAIPAGMWISLSANIESILRDANSPEIQLLILTSVTKIFDPIFEMASSFDSACGDALAQLSELSTAIAPEEAFLDEMFPIDRLDDDVTSGHSASADLSSNYGWISDALDNRGSGSGAAMVEDDASLIANDEYDGDEYPGFNGM